MKIALVDDLAGDRNALFNTLVSYANDRKQDFDISVFEDGEALLSSYKPLKYDLIFLDIYMNGISGIETAAKIRETDDETKIVFLTTSNECQAEAIHFHVYDYINKDEQPGATVRVLDRLTRRSRETAEPVLSFNYERKVVKVPYSNILSVVSAGNNLMITTTDHDEYKPRMTFSSVKDLLAPDPRFEEILRGVIVNMNCITELTADYCLLADGRQFPVSLRKSRKLIREWHDFLFAQARQEGGT